jgi:urea transporter
VLFGNLLVLVAATLTALCLRVDAAGLAARLNQCNALLVGLALPAFLAPTPMLWGFVLLGGAVSVVAIFGTAIRTAAAWIASWV